MMDDEQGDDDSGIDQRNQDGYRQGCESDGISEDPHVAYGSVYWPARKQIKCFASDNDNEVTTFFSILRRYSLQRLEPAPPKKDDKLQSNRK